ncbi:hypothetical protein HJG60_009847 [Phyllostomus discolor]|uniref:Uncharacterized protein n=1 Tax=Phyllostomus discolor TaxID=89673 RepID=A0A834B9N6_9CHIR|nr:hypothetical protein HJG60_009847 [Phyllostomus discolor]
MLRTYTGALPLQALTTCPSPAPSLGSRTLLLLSLLPSTSTLTPSYLLELQQRLGWDPSRSILSRRKVSEKWLMKISRIQTPVSPPPAFNIKPNAQLVHHPTNWKVTSSTPSEERLPGLWTRSLAGEHTRGNQ